MKPFVDWINEDKYYIRDDWDALEGWVGAGYLKLKDYQEDILRHCFTSDENGDFPYITVIYSTVKKSGKTTILGALGSWVGEEGPAYAEAYSLANDEDQAEARAFKDMKYHASKRGIRSTKYLINWPNESFTQAIASEYKGAAGGRQMLTMWDELWGYTTEKARRLWAEMTPPPTVRNPLRVITTYAGREGESDLLWDLYEQGFIEGEVVPELAHIVDDNGEPVCRRNGRLFVYWDTVPRMPWQTDEYYEEQMATLRPSDFLRLHRNEWVTSDEEFIPISYYDDCTTLDGPLLYQPDSEYRQAPISVGVDAAYKNDHVAVVGTYYDPQRNKIGVAFHRIWVTNPKDPFDLNLVEDYIREVAQTCSINAIVYDPTQLHQAMTNLKNQGFRTVEFTQNSKKMTSATHHLYDIIKGGVLETYQNDDLRDHIKYAKVEIKADGMRMTKPHKRSRHKIDAAVALAMSAYDAVQRGGVDTSEIIRIESPFGDFTGWTKHSSLQEMEEKLPPELRS